MLIVRLMKFRIHINKKRANIGKYTYIFNHVQCICLFFNDANDANAVFYDMPIQPGLTLMTLMTWMTWMMLRLIMMSTRVMMHDAT